MTLGTIFGSFGHFDIRRNHIVISTIVYVIFHFTALHFEMTVELFLSMLVISTLGEISQEAKTYSYFIRGKFKTLTSCFF